VIASVLEGWVMGELEGGKTEGGHGMASFKRWNDLTLIRVYALWLEVCRNSALTAVMAALYGWRRAMHVPEPVTLLLLFGK
jgi:hypothetical protein